jgi:hypothetical protein
MLLVFCRLLNAVSFLSFTAVMFINVRPLVTSLRVSRVMIQRCVYRHAFSSRLPSHTWGRDMRYGERLMTLKAAPVGKLPLS